MLESDKNYKIDGRIYKGYKIKQSIFDLETDLIGMLVLYFGDNGVVDFIKTHWFKAEIDNDLNDLINRTHNLHTKWEI